MRCGKIGEELPMLQADITCLMVLAYPDDVSAMSKMIAGGEGIPIARK